MRDEPIQARENLINERKKAELTQKETALLLELSLRQYQSLEAGTSDGSMKVWRNLSRLFGKTIDYLLETTDEELFGAGTPNNSNHE